METLVGGTGFIAALIISFSHKKETEISEALLAAGAEGAFFIQAFNVFSCLKFPISERRWKVLSIFLHTLKRNVKCAKMLFIRQRK